MTKLTLQARAARELGIPWEVFDTLTPAQVDAIARDARKRWEIDQKQEDRRTARIIAALYLLHGAKDVDENTFIPEYINEDENISYDLKNELARTKIRNTLNSLTALSQQAYGG